MPRTLAPPTRRTPTLPAGLPDRLELIEAAAWADLAAAASPPAVQALALTSALVGSTTLFAAASSDVLALNRAIGLGICGPTTKDDLDAVARFFEKAGAARYFVPLSPVAEPGSLTEQLRARDFRYRNNWVKLVRRTAPCLSPRTDLRIEPLLPDRAEVFGRLVPPAFDWPLAMGDVLARTVGRSGWHHYAACDGDEAVAVAAMFVAGDAAWFGPAVTQPSQRGRGAQSALIARRLHDAARLGVRFAVTETAEERPEHPVVQSYRNMRRLGFQVAYARPNYLYDRSI